VRQDRYNTPLLARGHLLERASRLWTTGLEAPRVNLADGGAIFL
jgi:hypothetical protein